MAPDVGDIVEYGLDSFGKQPATYRVDAWLKPYVKPYKVSGHDMLMSGAMRKDLTKDDLVSALLHPLLEAAQPQDRRRLMWCRREDATHVSLSGICGAVAPIEDCKVIGRVSWSETMIQQHVEQALHFAKCGGVTDCYA